MKLKNTGWEGIHWTHLYQVTVQRGVPVRKVMIFLSCARSEVCLDRLVTKSTPDGTSCYTQLGM
jgi:hypothetical protein